MSPPRIDTPRGSIIITKNGKAELKFNTDFQPKWQKRFSDAQKWVDNEVLANCEKFIPLRTGMLIKSGILGTDAGSGSVQWIAPYARYQYYATRKPGSVTGLLRGPYWFERAKTIYKRSWIEGARRIAGKGSK